MIHDLFPSQVLQESNEPGGCPRHHSVLPGHLPQSTGGHTDHWQGRKDSEAHQGHADTQV